jgi:hypothetical protein
MSTERIQLTKEETREVYELFYSDQSDLREYILKKWWTYKIHDVVHTSELASDQSLERTIILVVTRKTPGEIFSEQLLHFISNLDVQEMKVVRPGHCPDCGNKVDGWKPMFGGLAPEWWATMRERGVDPATGHKINCRHRKL